MNKPKPTHEQYMNHFNIMEKKTLQLADIYKTICICQKRMDKIRLKFGNHRITEEDIQVFLGLKERVSTLTQEADKLRSQCSDELSSFLNSYDVKSQSQKSEK
jgi:hypothetical protein